jgi:uncharacterized protein YkwD
MKKDLLTIAQHSLSRLGAHSMGQTIRIVLLCATLGGCASVSTSSLTSLGSPNEPEPQKSAKAAPPASAAASAENSSGLGGIWTNFSSAFSSGAQPVAQKPVPAQADTNEALRLINAFRAKKNLSPLSIDPQVTAAAEALAKDLAKHDHMSHIGPDGQDVSRRLMAAGYPFRLAAENVAVGQASVGEVIEGWERSAPNSRNILLAGAKHAGIAFEYRPDTKYKTFWTLVVAAP